MWGLDPNGGADRATCGCSACVACVAHAANKLFPSAATADSGRAHTYCHCAVVPLATVDQTTFDALFVDGGARVSVDRRYQWVQAVLAQPAPNAPAESAVLPAVAPRLTPAAEDGALHATLRRVRIKGGDISQRILRADVVVAKPVTSTMTLTRQGNHLARKTVEGVIGTHRLTLPIPADTPAGPALLRLKLADAYGNDKRITRAIDIPPQQRPQLR